MKYYPQVSKIICGFVFMIAKRKKMISFHNFALAQIILD